MHAVHIMNYSFCNEEWYFLISICSITPEIIITVFLIFHFSHDYHAHDSNGM